MKAILITYHQALTEKVEETLDHLFIRGYTQWINVKGRGTTKGEPHMGTHTWPALNTAVLTVIEDDGVNPLLEELNKLNQSAEEQGLRAFVWNIEKAV